jgi:hypothetical protein
MHVLFSPPSRLPGVAPLFGFTAIALGLVGYVTTLFKLSAIFTILWARLFLGEGRMLSRLFGACVMVVTEGWLPHKTPHPVSAIRAPVPGSPIRISITCGDSGIVGLFLADMHTLCGQ